jgi:HEAT repeat protein
MSRLSRLMAIRPGEAGIVARLAASFAILEAARGVGEIGADTLVLGRFGAGVLPYLYVGLGIVGIVAALGFSVGVGRIARRRFFSGLLVGMPVVLVLERAALATDAAAVYAVLWLTVYGTGAIVATLGWAVAGWVLDVRQAKRLFPLCASAGILGGFVGMIAAGPLAALAGTANLVVVQAALLVAAAVLVAAIGSRAHEERHQARRRPIVMELRAGFDEARRSPLLRLTAVAYVLFAILFFAVSYPFFAVMTEAFPSDVELATALGLFSASVTAASFVVAVAFANRLYARLGIATVAIALPLVYLAGFGVWLVRFSLATAVGFRFAQQVTQRGLSNAVWSAFYNVVPGERRAQALAFMDGVPGQMGTILAGILLLVVSGLPSPTPIFVLGAAAAVVCAIVVLRIRTIYADSLLRTLRSGLGERLLEGGPGLLALGSDQAVVASLRAGLDDELAAVRRLSAELLGRLGASDSRSSLAAHLDDPDASVRVAVVGALSALDAPPAGAILERLAADPDPAVRAEVAVASVLAGDEDPGHGLLVALIEGATPAERLAGLAAVARLRGHAPSPMIQDALADPVVEVRAAALRALAAVDPPLEDPLPVLIRALDDDAGPVRLAAARALGERGSEVCPPILEVLRTGSDRAREAALVALEGHAESVRGEITAWALDELGRVARLRRQRTALDGLPGLDNEPSPDPGVRGSDASRELAAACVGYLGDVLAKRAERIEGRLVQALVVLDAPEAAGVIRRSLAADDVETRALATEALESIGDRPLRRAIIELVEGAPAKRPPAEGDILQELASQDDPWVGRLARRAIAARGGEMPETAETLSEIERMLVLRRVALFSGLDPEDLQRIAASADERWYVVGEALVREGDAGDELIVLVEGNVRVVQGDGPDARLLRTFGPGDHIGELAVLREQRRVATVIADGGAVRGLAISGVGLKAVLRERPDAAMAMLATLAERIAAT